MGCADLLPVEKATGPISVEEGRRSLLKNPRVGGVVSECAPHVVVVHLSTACTGRHAFRQHFVVSRFRSSADTARAPQIVIVVLVASGNEWWRLVQTAPKTKIIVVTSMR